MPRTIGTTPRRHGARPRPRPATLGMRPPARRGALALGTEGSSAATTPGYRLRLPARRASCGTNSRTSCSPADTASTTLPPLGATCAGSTSRTWTSARGTRAGCLPHRVGIVLALPPCQQHARDVRPPLLRAHDGPPGAQLPVVRGAQEPAQRGGRDARD